MKTNINNNIKAIILSIIIVLGVQQVYAVFGTWTAPTAAPPGNNTLEPINVGSVVQTKEGNLVLHSTGNTAELITDLLTVKQAGSTIAAGQVLTAVDNTGRAQWAVPAVGTGVGPTKCTIAHGKRSFTVLAERNTIVTIPFGISFPAIPDVSISLTGSAQPTPPAGLTNHVFAISSTGFSVNAGNFNAGEAINWIAVSGNCN